MNLWTRLVLSIPLWIAYEIPATALTVLGWFVIPVLALRESYGLRQSEYFDRTVLNWNSRWVRAIWGNSEDGIDGLRGGDPAQSWWRERTAKDSDFRRIVKWSAFRNSTANLRYIPIANPKIDPSRIRFIGMDHEPAKGEGGWYFCWLAGTPYSCIRYETKRWRFWWGYAFKPTDGNGLSLDDPRAIRARMLFQFKRVA